jgi:hypothetical protein
MLKKSLGQMVPIKYYSTSELCINQLDKNMISKNNSEVMVTSFTQSIEDFMGKTKNEIIASNIHYVNALTTSIDIVNKFRNDFQTKVNALLEQFQSLDIKSDDPKLVNFRITSFSCS